MKMTFNIEKLKEGLAICSKALGGNSVSKITANVLFVVNKDTSIATLTCFDELKHLTISTRVDVLEADEGEGIIDCKLLTSFVNKLNSSEITIEFINNQVILSSGNSRIQLATMDAATFPRMSKPNVNSSIVVPANTLATMVKNVCYAASTNEINKLMTGINITTSNNVLKVVALDGLRIAINETILKNEAVDIDIIVEAAIVTKFLDKLHGDISISTGSTNVLFEDNRTTISMQLIEGKFYNLSSFVKNNSDKKITINKALFNGAIDRATILADAADKKPLICDITNNNITLLFVTNLGNAKEDVACETTGENIKIALNPMFLIDALRAIKDDTVVLNLTNPRAPMVIEGEGYKHLIMPVNF